MNHDEPTTDDPQAGRFLEDNPEIVERIAAVRNGDIPTSTVAVVI